MVFCIHLSSFHFFFFYVQTENTINYYKFHSMREWFGVFFYLGFYFLNIVGVFLMFNYKFVYRTRRENFSNNNKMK